MRGTRWENVKSAAIAIMLGMLAMTGLTWESTVAMIGGGYIVAQIAWIYLISYDEIQRKRRETKRRYDD